LSGGIVLVAFVLYGTLAPPVVGASLLDDKLAHFLAFAALMAWFGGVFRPGGYPLVALCLLLLGMGIEIVQAQLTYRAAEVADVLFDLGGIAVAWILAAAGLGKWAELIESHVVRRPT